MSSYILQISWLFYVVLFLFTITEESSSIFNRSFCIWFCISILFLMFCSYFARKDSISFILDSLSPFASSDLKRSSSKTDCFMYVCFFTLIRWRYSNELITYFHVSKLRFYLLYLLGAWDYFFKSISYFLNSKDTEVLFYEMENPSYEREKSVTSFYLSIGLTLLAPNSLLMFGKGVLESSSLSC